MELLTLDLIHRSIPLLLKGAFLTIEVLLLASVISLFLGSLMGTLTSQKLKITGISIFLEGITFVLRAVPFYVQLLIVYFVLPDVLGIQIDAFTASFVSLGFCSAGYIAQVVRCGINSIAIEQWEAAYTLGYSIPQTMRYIIFPQMLRNILPALTNELDSLLKSTAILASIGLLELTRMGMNIISREMEPVPIYLAVAMFYIMISGCLNLFSKWLEGRLRYANS